MNRDVASLILPLSEVFIVQKMFISFALLICMPILYVMAYNKPSSNNNPKVSHTVTIVMLLHRMPT